KQALAGHYDASRETLQQLGLAPDWSFDPAAHADSATAFVGALNALTAHHSQAFGHLAAVFMPSAVSNEAGWIAWMLRALDALVSEPVSQKVRLIVTDSLDAPRCAALASSRHPALHAESLPLDGWSLAHETFALEPAVGPAGVFRSLLAGLFALVRSAPAEQVKIKAEDALAFARRQGWPDQQVVVRLLAAGAMLKDDRKDEALNHYRHARMAADEAIKAGHAAGRQLLVQAWFGEASAHLAANDLPQAARCYVEAESVAQGIPNLVLAIEALRMAAYCHSRLGQSEPAIAFGHQALEVGARLQPSARNMTTLPLVAFELLRLLQPQSIALVAAIKRQLQQAQAQRLAATEEECAALERRPDARERLQALHEAHEQHDAMLMEQAARQIESASGCDDARFVDLLAQTGTLLGSGWLLNLPSDQLQPAGSADLRSSPHLSITDIAGATAV
ncbi:MAG TPA: hypothetical protein VFP68_09750, partial [Burkholderiaceae bacterium]|nr:hypothetical protein [Burkholderiaceae bacterium]